MAEWKKILVEGDAAELQATDGSMTAVTTSALVGTSSTAARSDHVHDLAEGAIDASNLFAANVVNTAAITDGAVTTAKMNIDSDLDFNANAALDFGTETVSSMTSSAVTSSEFVGRIVFNNTDSRPYIYI
ncbi:MAG: hypothetical protein ACTSPI_07995 [Candidatus Heimdallarchaeaceae archaeon]